jgi:hypothetical protein
MTYIASLKVMVSKAELSTSASDSPLILVWPIAYTQFILITSAYFYKKTKLLKASSVLYVGLIAAGFDYLENIMTSTVLFRFPQTTPIIADMAGIVTLLKWSTLSLAFVILVFLMIVATFTQLKQRLTR